MVVTLSQSLPFVHPGLAAAGLAAGAIPVLIHLINHRRYVRIAWAAMPFLLAANRRSARRIRIEQWLLLATRVLLVVLLGMAIARPYMPAASVLPFDLSRVHRVILLDNSLSMRARAGTEATRFARAKAAAERLLASFPQRDPVSIVTIAAPAEAVVAQASYDRRFVRERLMGLTATQRATDTLGALQLTRTILNEAEFPPGNRAAYLVSDMPADPWQRTTAAATPDEEDQALAAALKALGAGLTMVRVAGEPPPNVGLTSLEAQAPMASVHVPAVLTAEVANFAAGTVRDVTLELRDEGRIVRRQTIAQIEPGRSESVTVRTRFTTPGTHLIEARVVAEFDALPEDNTRVLSLEVRESVPVLLVDGRPGADPLSGQTGFLVTALAPRVSDVQPSMFAPTVITPAELPTEPLAAFEVIALCNVPRLEESTWELLETFVAVGGGLLVFGGDLVTVDNYNRFGFADGEGLLPGRLQPAPPEPADPNEALQMQSAPLTHPIASVFRGHPGSGLFAARFRRILPIEPAPERSDIVLSFTNGEPALVVSRFDRGRVAYFASTANMDWNNLPARGDYVSLMLSTVMHLTPRRGEHRNIIVGGRIVEPLAAAQHNMPLRVTLPDGAGVEPSLVPSGDGLALTADPIEAAGPITVSIGPTVRRFAANVPSSESDLTVADVDALRRVTSNEARIVSDADALDGTPVTARATELGTSVLYLAAALVLLEMWMAMWFGTRRT